MMGMNERRIRQIIREELDARGVRQPMTLIERIEERVAWKLRVKTMGRELAEHLSQIPGFPPLKELK